MCQCATVTDVFGTVDPFASHSFGSKGGFADFSQMSKVSFTHSCRYELVSPWSTTVRRSCRKLLLLILLSSWGYFRVLCPFITCKKTSSAVGGQRLYTLVDISVGGLKIESWQLSDFFSLVNRNQTAQFAHQRKMCLTGLHLPMVSRDTLCLCVCLNMTMLAAWH